MRSNKFLPLLKQHIGLLDKQLIISGSFFKLLGISIHLFKLNLLYLGFQTVLKINVGVSLLGLFDLLLLMLEYVFE